MADIIEMNNYTHIYINLIHMSLDCGRKTEGTHADMKRRCKLLHKIKPRKLTTAPLYQTQHLISVFTSCFSVLMIDWTHFTLYCRTISRYVIVYFEFFKLLKTIFNKSLGAIITVILLLCSSVFILTSASGCRRHIWYALH